MLGFSLAVAVLALGIGLEAAPEDHVTFIVMGKTANTRQAPDGALTLLNYHFFAEIFVKDGGSVTGASLAFPDGKTQPFEDLGFVQEVHGGRYGDEPELDRAYPNGSYTFRFSTPSGPIGPIVDVDGRVLRVRGTGEGASRIPKPVRITLHQGGREISATAVDPERDLTVTWSPFDGAGADANGILDDLMFVVLGDCRGEKTVHSGRPFEGTGYLSYSATEYVIPKNKLAAGEPHQLFIEQAKVDTSKEDGIVGLVTYAATTFLDFETTGNASGPECPSTMPKIDGGQTDRPSAR